MAVTGARRAGALPDPAFWRGRKVLLTGHTGFKGAWAALWLSRMGAQVHGLALEPETELFSLLGPVRGLTSRIGDIADARAVAAAIDEARPDIVIHMAAQALVRRSYADPAQTYAVNVMGLVHVLEALRAAPAIRVCLVTTTDKVYENREDGRAFREGDPLGGHDPYSASKAAAEIVAASYRTSFFNANGPAIATARAGNVIGGGDFAPDRLVPDIYRAMAAGEAVRLRYPGAERPWQHVLDCLCGYFVFAERLAAGDAPYAVNFGPNPDDPRLSVRQVAERLQSALGGGGIDREAGEHPREMGLLSLDNALAKSALGWRPRWSVGETIARTAAWYGAFRNGASASDLCRADLEAYLEAP